MDLNILHVIYALAIQIMPINSILFKAYKKHDCTSIAEIACIKLNVCIIYKKYDIQRVISHHNASLILLIIAEKL